MDELNKTDLHAFDPISRETTFLWNRYTSDFIFQNSMLIEWYSEEGLNVELVDFSGNEHHSILTDVKRITSHFSRNPSGMFFYIWRDENSDAWITQVVPDEFQVQTRSLDTHLPSQYQWFQDTSLLAYSGYTEEENQAGIIDVVSGEQVLSLNQSQNSIQVVPSNLSVIGFTSRDDNGNTWLDIYESDGAHLYRIHATDSNGFFVPSPNQNVWAITTRAVSTRYDIALYGLRLSKRDEPDSELIRIDLSEISYLTWSPDGERLAFASSDYHGVRRIEVVTKDGEDVQSFADVWIPRYGDLEWDHCDSLE